MSENICEFLPVNENIIKTNIDRHNNMYINENNINSLNEKNKNMEILKQGELSKITKKHRHNSSAGNIRILNLKDNLLPLMNKKLLINNNNTSNIIVQKIYCDKKEEPKKIISKEKN